MGQVRRREDELDAGHRPRRFHVRDPEPCVGMGASQYDCPQAALWRVVVGIATAARQEPHVLDPTMRLADSKLVHRHGKPRELSVRKPRRAQRSLETERHLVRLRAATLARWETCWKRDLRRGEPVLRLLDWPIRRTCCI